MTVGEKIKYYRNIRGISQEMLGNLSGINPATIKKYEYGIRNPKPDQLLKITNALGVSIALEGIVELSGLLGVLGGELLLGDLGLLGALLGVIGTEERIVQDEVDDQDKGEHHKGERLEAQAHRH